MPAITTYVSYTEPVKSAAGNAADAASKAQAATPPAQGTKP